MCRVSRPLIRAQKSPTSFLSKRLQLRVLLLLLVNSTSYLSRSSSWQNFNVLNPRDSGLHKCLQRFSKRLQGVGQYWASTQMLSAAARGNCGKLEKWTAGKSTAWKLPDWPWKRGNWAALYLDGAVSARPRDWCYGLTCVLASPGNRASTQLADAGDYAPWYVRTPKWRRHCKVKLVDSDPNFVKSQKLGFNLKSKIS